MRKSILEQKERLQDRQRKLKRERLCMPHKTPAKMAKILPLNLTKNRRKNINRADTTLTLKTDSHQANPSIGKNLYDRKRDLPELLALWPFELEDESPKAQAAMICKLKTAIRHERQKGQTGHWSYNLQRHHALLKALQVEQARTDKENAPKLPDQDKR